MDRATRRDTPPSGGVAHGNQAGEVPALVLRHPENLVQLVPLEEQQARDGTADALGTGSEHGVPYGREYRAAGPVPLAEGEQQQRIAFEVVPHVLRGAVHLEKLLVVGLVGRSIRSLQRRAVHGGEQALHALSVERGEASDDCRIVDQHETPALGVTA